MLCLQAPVRSEFEAPYVCLGETGQVRGLTRVRWHYARGWEKWRPHRSMKIAGFGHDADLPGMAGRGFTGVMARARNVIGARQRG
jgi:hypothetical protein